MVKKALQREREAFVKFEANSLALRHSDA